MIDDIGEGLGVSKEGSEYRGCPNQKGLTSWVLKWFICQKRGHFMRDCLERRDNGDSIQIVVDSDEDSYESVRALVVSSLDTKKSSIMTHVTLVTCV